MSSAAAFTLLASATVSAYPADAVLAAFREGCAELGSVSAASASAAAHGWRPIAEDGASPVAAVIKFGKDAVADDPDVKLQPGAAFERDVAGRQLYLAISAVSNGGVQSRGCRLYDFAATQPLDPTVLEAWIGRAPDETVTPIAGLTKIVWNPGITPEQTEFEATHLVPGTRLPIAAPLSGLVLTAQAVEFE